MTEDELFLFDLQGYLIIPGVIPPAVLREMNLWLDQRALESPKWRGQTGNDHVESPIMWTQAFRNLMDDPRVMPYLRILCGDGVRLDHDYAIFLEPGHKGLPLHGPNTVPFDPCHYYLAFNGKVYSGLTVALYALNDVPAGSGGLAVISGSHKSNFDCPEDIKSFKRSSPVVQQVQLRAGDCVIFTEALIHGTLPWTGPGTRRTLFYKYAPSNLAWDNRTYLPTKAFAYDVEGVAWTAAQRSLLEPASAINFHQKSKLMQRFLRSGRQHWRGTTVWQTIESKWI